MYYAEKMNRLTTFFVHFYRFITVYHDYLTVFKSRLKTFLFNQAFTEYLSNLPRERL